MKIYFISIEKVNFEFNIKTLHHILNRKTSTKCNKYNPIHEQITFMNKFSLVNQKHTTQPVQCDSHTNDSNEQIIFSEIKTYGVTSIVPS